MLTTDLFKFFLFKLTCPRLLLLRLLLLAALTWSDTTLPGLAQANFQEPSGVELPATSEPGSSANNNQPQNNNNQVTNPNYWGDAKNMTGGQLGTYRNPYTGAQPGSNGQSLSYRPNTQSQGGSKSSGSSSSGFSPMRMGMMGLGAASLGMRGMSRQMGRMGHHMGNQGSASEKQMAKMEERRRKQEEKMRKELEKAKFEAQAEEKAKMSKLNSQEPDLPKKRVEGDLLNETAEDSF
jgi:hypothetical protein